MVARAAACVVAPANAARQPSTNQEEEHWDEDVDCSGHPAAQPEPAPADEGAKRADEGGGRWAAAATAAAVSVACGFLAAGAHPPLSLSSQFLCRIAPNCCQGARCRSPVIAPGAPVISSNSVGTH